jgi:uncharacterized protein
MKTNLTVEKIISILELKPLSVEGGYYKETYRSFETINRDCLPKRYKSSKAFSTAIYYLLTPDSFSALHSLPTDEIYHFYIGDPVEMLLLKEDGSGQIIKIGQNLEEGMFPQIIVPKGTWHGSSLIEGGKFALLGATVAPAFDFEDFTPPDKDYLTGKYPEYKSRIEKLI